MPHSVSRPAITRRKALGLIGITAGGGLFMSAAAFSQRAGGPERGEALIPAAGVCAITPEVTEGPFYFDPGLERADIRDGRPGLPLKLVLQIVDARCRPLAGRRVDVWHCDAQGLYSGYERQSDGRDIDTTGETFLRGVQHTDGRGIARFSTIYPGWYRGRTTHIHFKVFPGARQVMTGQIFFPDGVSDRVFDEVEPYRDRAGRRDRRNGDDFIAREAGEASLAALRQAGEGGFEASLIVGVEAPA